MREIGHWLILGAMVALSGCDLFTDPAVCNLYAAPALTVAVKDSVTGDWVPADFRIRAVAGEFEDGVEIPADVNVSYPFGLAHEQPGTYRVEVDADGYRPWQKSGIVVTADECHVRTVEVTARLQRP